MLLHPVPKGYHVAVIKQNSVSAAREIAFLKICDNRAVNAHDSGVAILFTILFTRHNVPSFYETSMFRQSILQLISDRSAGLCRDYSAHRGRQHKAPF